MIKRNIHFFQPQYVAVVNQVSNIWLPYSVGCLWAYAQTFPDIADRWQLAKLHYRRWPIAQVLESLDNPAVCAFSCYTWNEQYCLRLAEAVKQKWPECFIIFGGPQTGGNHIQYEFIDSMVMAEGEESFVEILRCLDQGTRPDQFYSKKRIESLDIPSPYELGIFDPIIQENPNNVYFNAVLETNRGCPYACTYCDWGGVTYSKIRKFDLDRIRCELEWFKHHRVKAVFIADANFGIFKERDQQIAKLIVKVLEHSDVDLVNMAYLKNSNETAFEIFKEFGKLAHGVTLSLQSMNPDTLKAIKRDNMKSNDLKELLYLSDLHGVTTYTDMILGLPLETLESWNTGLCQLLELGQHDRCDMYLCNVLENTELNLKQRQQFDIKTIQSENYNPFSLSDEADITEYAQLVTSTSTMTTDEMVHGFMYHFIIQNFHFTGYSQLLSKYCRNVLNISYKDFYDKLYNIVSQDTGKIGEMFREQQQGVREILTHGRVLKKQVEVHSFYYQQLWNFYKNIDTVYELTIKAVTELAPELDLDVIQLQYAFIARPNIIQDTIVESKYDIQTWEPRHIKYCVKTEIDKPELTQDDFARLRKKGLLKNRFVDITLDTELSIV
jgi:tRNA A37 methylthiotransferase MiaB